MIKQGGGATPSLKINAANGFVVHDDKLHFIPINSMKIRNTDDTADLIEMLTTTKNSESFVANFDTHTIGLAPPL